MAHLIVDFYADALGMETRMHVLLPQRLHGQSQDALPSARHVGRRGNVDAAHGHRPLRGRKGPRRGHAGRRPWLVYGHAPRPCAGSPSFPRSCPPSAGAFSPSFRTGGRTPYIGGLSMGGYGALKCGLRAPQTFSKVISLSGALDAADTAVNNTVPATRALLGGRLRPGGRRARLGKRPLRRRRGADRPRPAAQNLHVVRHGGLPLRPEHAHARSSARAGLRPDL